jgi:hypothetical protein
MSFLDAYLVAENSIGAPPVGVVRKDGNVWRILQFGIPADQQPSEVFATRREGGGRPLDNASPNKPQGEARRWTTTADASTGPGHCSLCLDGTARSLAYAWWRDASLRSDWLRIR